MVSAPTAPPPILAALFRGLADPARLSCLLAIHDRPRPVGEIVETTGLSQPNVSKHLACLRDCGLVTAERSGRFVVYQLSDPRICDILCAAEALALEVGESLTPYPRYEASS